MDQHEQRVLLRRIEAGRQCQHVVYARTALRLEPEFLHRPPVDQGGALGIEGGERAARAVPVLDARHFGRAHGASPIRDDHRRVHGALDLQPGERPGLEAPDLANLPACCGHCEQALAAVVLGEQIDGLAVRAQPVAADGAVEDGCHGPRRRVRPVESHQAVVVVGKPGIRRRAGIERGAVRGKARLRVARLVAGDAPRLAATRRHRVERLLNDCARGLVARDGRGEDDGAAVGRPGCFDEVAVIVQVAAEARGDTQLRTRNQVARLGPVAERLQHERRPALVEPAVPMTDGELLEDPRVVLA